MSAPDTVEALLQRARALAGLRLRDVAETLGVPPPHQSRHAKGWSGALLEVALGADAGNRPEPDFTRLGVELKTIPIDARGVPRESTYVCRAPGGVRAGLRWEDSTVRCKLAHVLWLPIESSREPDPASRRIGWARLWQPTPAEDAVLRADWEELVDLLATGQRHAISAHLGRWLQLRPKGADAAERAPASDESGAPCPMPPRGFYLRATATRRILAGEALA
ncbi:MAG: DNA mismatch repair endonuclease MutH [Gammaproteobacteria bacterium]